MENGNKINSYIDPDTGSLYLLLWGNCVATLAQAFCFYYPIRLIIIIPIFAIKETEDSDATSVFLRSNVKSISRIYNPILSAFKALEGPFTTLEVIGDPNKLYFM